MIHRRLDDRDDLQTVPTTDHVHAHLVPIPPGAPRPPHTCDAGEADDDDAET
jgi:hypothetical protein